MLRRREQAGSPAAAGGKTAPDKNCGPYPGYPCGTRYYTVSISDFRRGGLSRDCLFFFEDQQGFRVRGVGVEIEARRTHYLVLLQEESRVPALRDGIAGKIDYPLRQDFHYPLYHLVVQARARRVQHYDLRAFEKVASAVFSDMEQTIS